MATVAPPIFQMHGPMRFIPFVTWAMEVPSMATTLHACVTAEYTWAPTKCPTDRRFTPSSHMRTGHHVACAHLLHVVQPGKCSVCDSKDVLAGKSYRCMFFLRQLLKSLWPKCATVDAFAVVLATHSLLCGFIIAVCVHFTLLCVLCQGIFFSQLFHTCLCVACLYISPGMVNFHR